MKTVKELFPGIMVGTENETITNPFSGESWECTPDEVAVYDLLKGCEMLKDYRTMRKCLDWFISNSPKAYMVLLD